MFNLSVPSPAISVDLRRAAALTGIPPATLRKFVREGRLKVVRLNRRLLFEIGELRRLIEAGKEAK